MNGFKPLSTNFSYYLSLNKKFNKLPRHFVTFRLATTSSEPNLLYVTFGKASHLKLNIKTKKNKMNPNLLLNGRRIPNLRISSVQTSNEPEGNFNKKRQKLEFFSRGPSLPF